MIQWNQIHISLSKTDIDKIRSAPVDIFIPPDTQTITLHYSNGDQEPTKGS